MRSSFIWFCLLMSYKNIMYISKNILLRGEGDFNWAIVVALYTNEIPLTRLSMRVVWAAWSLGKRKGGLWGVYARVARTIPPPYLFVFDDRTSEVWKTLAVQIWIAQSSRDENSGISKETTDLLDQKVPTLMSE